MKKAAVKSGTKKIAESSRECECSVRSYFRRASGVSMSAYAASLGSRLG